MRPAPAKPRRAGVGATGTSEDTPQPIGCSDGAAAGRAAAAAASPPAKSRDRARSAALCRRARTESSCPMWLPSARQGLWLTPRRDILERAVAKRLFARAARRPVIGAGRILPIASKPCWRSAAATRSGWRAGPVWRLPVSRRSARPSAPERSALLLSALDGAEGGRSKIRALGRDLPLATVLTAAEMGAVFGRDHVVHVARRRRPAERPVACRCGKARRLSLGSGSRSRGGSPPQPGGCSTRRYWIEMSDANEQEQNTTSKSRSGR